MIFGRLKKSTPEQEEEFGRMFEAEKVGWKDKLAMLISAYLVIMVPIMLFLLVFIGIALFAWGLL